MPKLISQAHEARVVGAAQAVIDWLSSPGKTLTADRASVVKAAQTLIDAFGKDKGVTSIRAACAELNAALSAYKPGKKRDALQADFLDACAWLADWMPQIVTPVKRAPALARITAQQLLEDLQAIPEHHRNEPVFYVTAQSEDDDSVFELESFRLRLRGSVDGWASGARVEGVIRRIDTTQRDALQGAVNRVRAEADGSIKDLADMINFYLDNPASGDALLKHYKDLDGLQAIAPTIDAARRILTDTDPDTGETRILYSRALREAAAFTLQGVTAPDFSGRANEVAKALLAGDAAPLETVEKALEQIAGMLDDLRNR